MSESGGLFRTLKENQASYFLNYRLLYVHCVAKDHFEVSLAYLACVKMICREIHVSFVDKMNERGVALVPRIFDERNVDDDDIFKDATSPVLIRINSSQISEMAILSMKWSQTKVISSFEFRVEQVLGGILVFHEASMVLSA